MILLIFNYGEMQVIFTFTKGRRLPTHAQKFQKTPPPVVLGQPRMLGTEDTVLQCLGMPPPVGHPGCVWRHPGASLEVFWGHLGLTLAMLGWTIWHG